MLLRPRGDRTSRDGGRPGLMAALLMACVLGLVGSGTARADSVVPGNGELAKGRDSFLQGRFDEALDEFESALVQDPDDPLISLAVGETLFQLERYEEALAEFERTLALTEDKDLKAEALYNSGTTLLASGDPEKAADKLRQSLAMDISQADALHNLEVALKRVQEQQQEQQEQQQDDQEKQDEEKQEDENKDQEQQQQEQQEQEQQEQQEQEQQEQQEQDEQQEQEQQQQEQEQEQTDQPEEQQEPEDSESEELTQEQALQILKALDRDEEELKKSVQKRLKGGKPKSGKKW
jgi:Ca-activated chloride channel family protein